MIFGAIAGVALKSFAGAAISRLSSGGGGSSSSKGASAYEQFTQQSQLQQARMQAQGDMIKAEMKRMERVGDYMAHLKPGGSA